MFITIYSSSKFQIYNRQITMLLDTSWKIIPQNCLIVILAVSFCIIMTNVILYVLCNFHFHTFINTLLCHRVYFTQFNESEHYHTDQLSTSGSDINSFLEKLGDDGCCKITITFCMIPGHVVNSFPSFFNLQVREMKK